MKAILFAIFLFLVSTAFLGEGGNWIGFAFWAGLGTLALVVGIVDLRNGADRAHN